MVNIGNQEKEATKMKWINVIAVLIMVDVSYINLLFVFDKNVIWVDAFSLLVAIWILLSAFHFYWDNKGD